MSIRTLLLATALAAAATPALAADPFCDALNKLVAAAEEEDPFASQKVGGSDGMFGVRDPVPGFRPSVCSIANMGFEFGQGPSAFCRQTLAPPELNGRDLAAEVMRCTGADIEPNPARQYEVSFLIRGVIVRIEESGTDRGKVGRSVGLIVRRAGPADHAD